MGHKLLSSFKTLIFLLLPYDILDHFILNTILELIFPFSACYQPIFVRTRTLKVPGVFPGPRRIQLCENFSASSGIILYISYRMDLYPVCVPEWRLLVKVRIPNTRMYAPPQKKI